MPFQRPTTTPTPDEIFDVWLKKLSEGELKVLLYIVRRTLGFRKDRDAISYDQFLHGITTRDGRVLDGGCLTSRATLKKALDGLEAKGLIRAHKSKTEQGDSDITLYSLYFDGDDAIRTEDDPRALPAPQRGGFQSEPRWFPKRTTPSAQTEPQVVRKANPQQTAQQTAQQQVGGTTRRRNADDGPHDYTGGRYGHLVET